MLAWSRAALSTCAGLVIAIPASYASALIWAIAGGRALPDEAVLLGSWALAALLVSRRRVLLDAVGRAARLSAAAHLAAPLLHLALAGDARFSALSLWLDLGFAACAAFWWALALWTTRAARVQEVAE
jgi:hypothetical protein